jgi:hypothetical protein
MKDSPAINGQALGERGADAWKNSMLGPDRIHSRSAGRHAIVEDQPTKLVERILWPPESGSDIAALSDKDFKIRLADTEAGRNSASMLINKRYAWRGYSGVKPLQQNPSRITLTAYMKDVLVGTVTLAIDSSAGLLADEVFKDELDRFRRPGRKLCELTKLAVDNTVNSKFALASLFHICFIYGRRLHQCTDVFIEVNPRHRVFYERMLGFTRLGEIRSNPRVNAPAHLLRLDLDFVEEQILKFGGTSDHAGATRSLYPFFFSAREEAGLTRRLVELN